MLAGCRTLSAYVGGRLDQRLFVAVSQGYDLKNAQLSTEKNKKHSLM